MIQPTSKLTKKWCIKYADGVIVELWRKRCPSRLARSIGGYEIPFEIKLISLVSYK